MLSSMSPSLSFNSNDDMQPTDHHKSGQSHSSPSRSAQELLLEMVESVDRYELKQAIKREIQRIFSNHERLLTMLQSRSEVLEQENDDYKTLASEHQQRYEKAVREMQFFRKRYEGAMDMNKKYVNSAILSQPQQPQEQHNRPRGLSLESNFLCEEAEQLQHHPYQTAVSGQSSHPNNKNSTIQSYPLTPTSPQPSAVPNDMSMFGNYDMATAAADYSTTLGRQQEKSVLPSRSSSTSTNQTTTNLAPQWHPSGAPHHYSSTDTVTPPLPRLRQNSTTASLNSSHSSTTENSSLNSGSNTNIDTMTHTNSNGNSAKDKSNRKKQSWQSPSNTAAQKEGSNVTAGTATTTSTTSVHSVPMTPVRSSTATNGYTGASLIQQRRVDPLIFGGSDALWDTISKSKGSDVTVEKIISNFLRRGGSPNTAKQSSTANAVKYGYGMIHALIVTKAPGSLDLLLQQGANPNVYSLGQIEDDKVTPCYMAASVGWLAGLQKLVQAGGDLLASRGGGEKNKTALHVAAEHCHAAVVEYIVEVTQGQLNLELDSLGASVLHYACASGHTDLVSFLARSCEIPVNQEDHNGELPLHWAARHGRLEVVTLLVERCGCDCNTYVSRKVGTPLDLARAGGHRRLVDYLKGLGAMSGKKMDKRREEEMAKEVPVHLESTLASNGLFGMGDDDF